VKARNEQKQVTQTQVRQKAENKREWVRIKYKLLCIIIKEISLDVVHYISASLSVSSIHLSFLFPHPFRFRFCLCFLTPDNSHKPNLSTVL
jgi:hypothetical protein